MTVHGAKGLEAPIVILADTTTPPEGPIQHQPRLLTLPAESAAPGTPDRLVWIPTKKDDTAPVAAARDASRRDAEDEYRRLLYVAMTRAADRLVICGSDGRIKRPDGCWYNLVTAALKDALQRGGRRRRRRRRAAFSQVAGCSRKRCRSLDGRDAGGRRAAPGLADARRAVAKPTPLAPLSPSQLYDETAPAAHRRRRGAAAGAGARRRDAPAAAVAAGDRAGASQPRPRAAILPARAGTSPPTSARSSRARRLAWSSIPTSPRCSRRRAGPRFRSSGAWSTAAAAAPSPASSIVWS